MNSGVVRVEKVGASNRLKKFATFFFSFRALLFWLVARYASKFSLFIDTEPYAYNLLLINYVQLSQHATALLSKKMILSIP